MLVPGAWLAEWSRKHPSGAAGVRRLPWPCVRDSGLLSHRFGRGWGAGSCCMAGAPGAWRPSCLHGRGGGVPASAGCISDSRCQARVSSLRATAMVAIFFPRRFAMAA